MKSVVALLIASCAHSRSSAPPAPPGEPSGQVSGAETSPDETAPEETAAPAPAPPPTPAPSRGTTNDPIAQQWVDAHNRARAKHCAKPLSWSPQIAAVAQKWANELKAKGCVFGHSGNQSYGENLAAGTEGALDPESTVAMWYDEVKIYKFPDGGFSMNTGHFTQLVWTDTERVGCGQVSCNGNVIIVCNYDPPGNYEGEYKEHVLPTSCKK